MARSNGSGRSALKGPPYYAAARYNPHGSGPQTPRDDKSNKQSYVSRCDSWTEPKGAPSDTPRPRG